MRVLVVASGNSGYIVPFIKDQVRSLNDIDIDTQYFLIKGRGIYGYLKNLKSLKKVIKSYQPDVIHAHYGLSGLLASLQLRVPVVVTFHGSDINNEKERRFSQLAALFCKRSIFVSQELADLIKKKNPIIIPCGVDLDIFYPMDMIVARKKMKLSLDKVYILFSSSFENEVKNYPLARASVNLLDDYNPVLLELRGYTREEVALLMNAVNCVLMTSFTEGSPQFIKEAMATNTPIVSTDVGDVSRVVSNTRGCYVAKANSTDLAKNLRCALDLKDRTKGRMKISELDNKIIALKLMELYKSLIN